MLGVVLLLTVGCTGPVEPFAGPDIVCEGAATAHTTSRTPGYRPNGADEYSTRADPATKASRQFSAEMLAKLPEAMPSGDASIAVLASAYVSVIRDRARAKGEDERVATARAHALLLEALEDRARRMGPTAGSRAWSDSLRKQPGVSALVDRRRTALVLASTREGVVADSAWFIDNNWEVAVAAADTLVEVGTALMNSSSTLATALQTAPDTSLSRILSDSEMILDSTRTALEWASLTAWIESGGTITPEWQVTAACPAEGLANSRVEECPFCPGLVKGAITVGKLALTGAAGGIVHNWLFGEDDSTETYAVAAAEGAAATVVVAGMYYALTTYANFVGPWIWEIFRSLWY